MILYAGDLHGRTGALKYIDKVARLKNAHAVVQVGDFGALWCGSQEFCDVFDFFERRPAGGPTWYTCGGNHENWNTWLRLASETQGPTVKLAKDCYYVKRGSVIEICGKLHGFLGGAVSVDRSSRIEQVSWWAEEVPTKDDVNEFFENVSQKKPEVFVTHEGPSCIPIYCSRGDYEYRSDPVSRDLEAIRRHCDWKPNMWVFGHHHITKEWHIDGTHFVCCGLHGDHIFEGKIEKCEQKV